MSIFKNEGISGDGVNTPLGIDTNYWTPYNETVLHSSSAMAYEITLSEPATAFSRLRIGMVATGEGRQYVEIEPPKTTGQVYTLHCLWGGTSGANQDVYTRYKFNGSYTKFGWANRCAYKNVGWAVNTATAFNGASTASGENWCRIPVYEVIGINRK
jgi:hypothetical protein